MEIFVDDGRIDSRPFDQNSVEEAMRRIQSDVCSPGQLVVGLRCNGEDIPSDTLAATLKQPVSAFERIELFTSTQAGLVTEAMTQAVTALDDMDQESQRVAELLNEGNTAEGIETLGKCMQVWRQIHEAVGKSIQMLGLDPEATTVNGEPLTSLLSKPKEMLLQVKEALTAQDYVLLADTLQYEVSEVADQWRAIATQVLQEAQQQQAAATDVPEDRPFKHVAPPDPG